MKKTIVAGGKYIEEKILDDILNTPRPPTEIETIVDGLLESVSKTESFLDLLRKIGKYDFRKNIHLSDVELTNMLNENITAQLCAAREYFLMFSYMRKDEKRWKEFGDFRTECMKEVAMRMKTVEAAG